jgi:hypothetical protein
MLWSRDRLVARSEQAVANSSYLASDCARLRAESQALRKQSRELRQDFRVYTGREAAPRQLAHMVARRLREAGLKAAVIEPAAEGAPEI